MRNTEPNIQEIASRYRNRVLLFVCWIFILFIIGEKESLAREIGIAKSNPLAFFAVDVTRGCSPLTVTITNQSVGADSYLWSFGDGNTLSSDDVLLEYTWQNDTDIPVEFQLSLTAISGADNDTKTITITVLPEVTTSIVAVSEISGCSPLQVYLDHQSTGATSFEWHTASGNIIIGEEFSFNYSNNSTSENYQDVVLLAKSPSWDGVVCQASDTVTMEIKPEPTAAFQHIPTTGCSPAEISFTNLSTGNGIVSVWNFGDGQPAVENNSPNFSYIIQNETDEPVVYSISLVVTNSFECTNQANGSTSIHPLPDASFTLSASTACNPAEISFTNLSQGAVSFQWNLGNGIQLQSFEPEPVFYTNPSQTDAVSFEIELVAESSFGCTDTAYATLDILPSPQASFTISNTTVCANNDEATITLQHNQPTQTTVDYWITNLTDATVEILDSQVISIDLPLQNQSDSPIVYNILQIVTHPLGCSDSLQRQVTVYPSVSAVISGDITSGCHPHTQLFLQNSQNIVSWRWDFEDGTSYENQNPEKTFFNTSTIQPLQQSATLTVTSQYGCSHDTISVFDVYPSPVAAFTIPELQVCAPADLLFENASSTTSQSVFQWSIDDVFSDPDESNNLRHIFLNSNNQPITSIIELLAANEFGCEDAFSRSLTVFPQVTAGFTISDSQGCNPFTVHLTPDVSGGESLALQWSYNSVPFSDSGIEFDFTFINPSTQDPENLEIMLMLESEYGCMASISHDLQVFPTPVAGFELIDTEGCAPWQLTFTDVSQGFEMEYQWVFEEGNESTLSGNQVYTYNLETDNDPLLVSPLLTLTNNFGCSDSYQQLLTVFPLVEANFTSENEGCSPFQFMPTNNSSGAQSYIWDFGNGTTSTAAEPSNTFINPSVSLPYLLPITLTAISQWGCTDSLLMETTVLPTPQVSISTPQNQICAPSIVTFQNNSMGSDQFQWFVDDLLISETSGNQQFEFSNSGEVPDTIVVSLMGQNDFGCLDSAKIAMLVFPEVQAEFSIIDGISEGCSPLIIGMNNQSNNATIWHWEFGDGNTSQLENPGYTFIAKDNQVSIYSILLEAISQWNCSDTTSETITVYPQPVADFEALPREQYYPEQTVYLTNYTSPGDWNFTWHLGDDTALETTSPLPVSHTFEGDNQTREYQIKLIAQADICSDSVEQSVKIMKSGPVAGFSISDSVGCPPLAVQFTNQSLLSSAYSWDFGDGNSSGELSPDYVFTIPGEYLVTLTASNDTLTNTSSRIITVHQPPVAAFEVLPSTNLTTEVWFQLVNQSSYAESVKWTFPDGNSSTVDSPSYIFYLPGTYPIELTAYNTTTPVCSDTVISTITVTNPVALPDCYLYFPNAFTPDASGPSGGTYAPGDPANNVFHPRHNGIESYDLKVFNRWGEMLFSSNDVEKGWDGYLNGQLLATGVYIFVSEATCETGRKISEKGDVMLLK